MTYAPLSRINKSEYTDKKIPEFKVKRRTAEQPPVAVVLKKQLILPLCTAAVESFRKNGDAPVEFSNSNASTNDQSKPWLDGGLFKEAMHDLLDEAVRYRDEKEAVKLSLCSGGMNSWRVDISYVLCKSAGERFTSTSGYPYFLPVRTREIISQHRARINFERKQQTVTIHISFEK